MLRLIKPVAGSNDFLHPNGSGERLQIFKGGLALVANLPTFVKSVCRPTIHNLVLRIFPLYAKMPITVLYVSSYHRFAETFEIGRLKRSAYVYTDIRICEFNVSLLHTDCE